MNSPSQQQRFQDIKTGERVMAIRDEDDITKEVTIITVPSPLMNEWGKEWNSGIFTPAEFSKKFRVVNL